MTKKKKAIRVNEFARASADTPAESTSQRADKRGIVRPPRKMAKNLKSSVSKNAVRKHVHTKMSMPSKGGSPSNSKGRMQGSITPKSRAATSVKPIRSQKRAAKTIVPELEGKSLTNGHHSTDDIWIAPPQVDVEPAVAEIPKQAANTGQTESPGHESPAVAAGGARFNRVRQLFSLGAAQPVAEPEVLQPSAQAEFAPLDRIQEAAVDDPEILQPGPQAEFREMAETTPLSAPEAVDPPEAETETAIEPAPKPVDEDLEYVRVIRAVAMIVIVAEHWAFPLIYRYDSILFSEWWTGTGIYLFGKAGSPLFAMISGLLLLNPAKDQTLQLFFKKRVMKVLVPFLGWSAIYLLWQMYWIGVEYSARDIIVAVIDGPVFYHLWFIQMIIGLYLATPIMRIYTRHTTRENMSYFLVVWFIGTGLFPIVRRFFGIEVGIDIYVMVGFMGYFLLGYYLRPIKLDRNQMMICLVGIAVFSLLTMTLTHWMTVRAGGQFDNFFALNTSANIMVLTTAFFLFLKSLDYKEIYKRHAWFKLFVTNTAGASFGLYLIHVLIIEEVRSGRLGFKYDAMSWNPAIAIPVLTLATMVVSVIIVKRMQQIPFVKSFVP